MSHVNGTALRSSLSFELFPPKDKTGIDRLISGTASRLAAFRLTTFPSPSVPAALLEKAHKP